jgi:hypothetical protein
MRTLYTFMTVAALTVLGPGTALAIGPETGTIVAMKTCRESTSLREILIRVNIGGTLKWFFIGTEGASSSSPSYTAIALAAMLSGKTVTIEYGSTITKCGVTVNNLESGTNRYLQINN